MASSSCVFTDGIEHDVFLSFREEDTRRNFTGHLLAALARNCIDAFVDDKNGGGEVISEALVSVVIFSRNYAGSEHCLDELVKIIECKENNGQTVLPVFLEVEPTHVRKQTGAFGDGFESLIQDQKFKDREEIWRRALVETANLSGWDSKEKSQDKIVEEIVSCVEKKLDRIVLHDQYDGFVGISRVEKVESLVCNGSSKRVHSIGIWGMGGIGKTTIAKLVFYRNSSRFEGACFISNVMAKSKRDGLDSVQKDMIIQLLGIQSSSIRHVGPHIMSPVVQRRLKRKKLLLVLDDVDSYRQLKALLGRYDIYGPGSRIIVTSRNKQILKNGCTEIYEVEKLNSREALLLFKNHAFKQDQPSERLIELSKEAVNYAQGLPLALEVLGCNLYGKNIEEWEIELAKLQEIPDLEVTDILRISYDGLDEMEKNIFLDIACLFQGWEKDRVEAILDGCGFYAGIGLSRLFDKALIAISNNELAMHDLLQQMGQDIVFQECIEEPGRRSRLWRIKDIHDVLTRNTGTERIEGISFDLTEVSSMHLKPKVFKNMTRLRVLHFQNYCWSMDIKVHLPKGLKFLPNQLRYFRWDGYPLPSLTTKFHPEYLVEIQMTGSHIKQLWSDQVELYLPNMKHINLAFSRNLTRLPNLSKALNLETLDLSFCQKLEEVSPSIQNLVMLKYIKLGGNERLLGFPDCSSLTKLQTLYLYGCSKITKVPEIPQNLISLNLSSTAIQELPSSIGCISQLQTLLLSECIELGSLPSSIGELKHLEDLDLVGCPRLYNLPQDLGNLKSLTVLNLDGTGIRSLPDNICNLSSLDKLTVRRCWHLTELPKNLGDLKNLRTLVTDRSPLKSLPSSIHRLTLLQHLSCQGYKGDTLPSFTGLPQQQNNVTGNLEFLGLVALEELHLQRSDLKSLTESIKCLSNLRELCLSNCKRLSSLPEVPSSVECLDATNCTSLEYTHSLFREDDEKLPPSFEFYFVNCLSLEGDARNKILSYIWQRIQTTVTHLLAQEPEDDNLREYTTACLHISGSEIPKWFKYHGIGSSLQVKESGNRRLDSCRLAFCAVVSVVPSDYPMDLEVQCKCLTESGEQLVSSCKYVYPEGDDFAEEEATNLESEHLFLWYDERELMTSPCSFCEATFEFHIVGLYDKEKLDGCVIVRCGVNPISVRLVRRRLLLPLTEDGDCEEKGEGASSSKRSKNRDPHNRGENVEEEPSCLPRSKKSKHENQAKGEQDTSKSN